MTNKRVKIMDYVSGKILEKDVLVTLLYSDVFEMPLTAFEVWRYRMYSGHLSNELVFSEGKDFSLSMVMDTLAVLVGKNLIARRSGMFVISGREYLVDDRIARMKRSDRKWKDFLKIAQWMRFSPFVRMIAVTGRLATKQIGANSDWDVLIVIEHGHIWMGRVFIAILLQILGKRRWGSHTKDRVCLNHFLSTEFLEVPLKDLFAAREYAYIIPVFGEETFRNFEKKNAWIQKYLPNWRKQEALSTRLMKDDPRISVVRGFLENVFGWKSLESWARKVQKRKIEKNPKTRLPGAYIVADDRALIFLPKPQGPGVFEKFMERIEGVSR